MIQRELFEVILEFEKALKKKQMPKFKHQHRVGQVLRLLQVAFLEDMAHSTAVDEERRARWEKFSDYPEVIEARKKWDK